MMARNFISSRLAMEYDVIMGKTALCDGAVDNFILLQKLCDSHGLYENFSVFSGRNAASVGVVCRAESRQRDGTTQKKTPDRVIRGIARRSGVHGRMGESVTHHRAVAEIAVKKR